MSNSAEQQGTHRLLRITDIQDGKVNWDVVPFATASDSDAYLLKAGDIVFARTGATVGKSFLVTETPYLAVYASYLIRIRLLGDLSSEYIYQFFNSACYWTQITDKSVGVGQPNCNGTSLKELFIPLPPINEQLKIVQTAQALLEYVAAIDTGRKDLLSIISNAKSKILDLAIRGKLVPQDPNDEPASVLLERIRAEKEELIKQGKIKRDKKESVIFKGEDNSYYETINGETICIDDELPFELPEGWEWTRLQNISSILTDGTHKTPQYSDNGYIFLSSKNVTTGKIDWKNVMYIPEELHEELYNRLAPKQGDILLAKNGTTGVAAIVDSDVVFDIYVSLALIRIAGRLVNSEYILNVICSSYVQEYFNKSLKGIGVPNLHLEHIRKTLIPIPPYTEQQRITKITERISKSLDEISGILS